MKTFLRDYLVLTVALLLLVAVFAFFAHSTGDFERFLEDLTSHGVSKKRLVIYLSSLFVGLFMVELFCRKFVQKDDTGRFAKPAYLLCFLPYLLYYGRFGVVMWFFAIPLAKILIFYYRKTQRFKTLFLWQYSMQVALIPFCMFVAVFHDGQVREIFLFEYKKMHIERENLTYREGWGWVDKVHYRDDHFQHLKKKIDAANVGEKLTLHLHDAWKTPLRIHVHVERFYVVTVPNSAELRWAVVAGVMLDFMTVSEQTQGDSPWYHGNQLSAWQFDDMASALLVSLDSAPESIKPKFGKDIFDKEHLQGLWLEQGREQISRKVREADLWRDYPAAKEVKVLVDKARVYWSGSADF